MNFKFKLIPVSPLALSLHSDIGQNEIVLTRVLRIGRNVQKHDGFALKIDWIQFSQSHCRVYCKDDEATAHLAWFVEDTSTNGTWVNAARVPKGGSLRIREGDILRLSCPPSEVLEYKFVSEAIELTEEKGDNYSMHDGLQQHKRRKTSEEHAEVGTADGAAAHRRTGILSPSMTAAASTVPAALQPQRLGLAEFEKQVADLSRKLHASRQEVDNGRSELSRMRAAAAAAEEQAEARRVAAAAEADARVAELMEGAARDAAAAAARADAAATRAADAEARHAAEAGARAAAEQAREQAEEAAAEARAALAEERAGAARARDMASAAVAELAELRRSAASMSVRHEAAASAAAEEAASLRQEVEVARSAAARAAEAAAATRARDAAEAKADRAARLKAEASVLDMQQALYRETRRADAAEERAQSADSRGALVRLRVNELSDATAAAAAAVAEEVAHQMRVLRTHASALSACPDVDAAAYAGGAGGNASSLPTQAASAPLRSARADSTDGGREGGGCGDADVAMGGDGQWGLQPAKSAAAAAATAEGAAMDTEDGEGGADDAQVTLQAVEDPGGNGGGGGGFGGTTGCHGTHAFESEHETLGRRLPETQMAWGMEAGIVAPSNSGAFGSVAAFGSAVDNAHIGSAHMHTATDGCGAASGALGSSLGLGAAMPATATAPAAQAEGGATGTPCQEGRGDAAVMCDGMELPGDVAGAGDGSCARQSVWAVPPGLLQGSIDAITQDGSREAGFDAITQDNSIEVHVEACGSGDGHGPGSAQNGEAPQAGMPGGRSMAGSPGSPAEGPGSGTPAGEDAADEGDEGDGADDTTLEQLAKAGEALHEEYTEEGMDVHMCEGQGGGVQLESAHAEAGGAEARGSDRAPEGVYGAGMEAGGVCGAGTKACAGDAALGDGSCGGLGARGVEGPEQTAAEVGERAVHMQRGAEVMEEEEVEEAGKEEESGGGMGLVVEAEAGAATEGASPPLGSGNTGEEERQENEGGACDGVALVSPGSAAPTSQGREVLGAVCDNVPLVPGMTGGSQQGLQHGACGVGSPGFEGQAGGSVPGTLGNAIVVADD